MDYDLSTLKAMCGDDPKFMHDFIQLFIDTTPPYLEEIERARKDSDWLTVGEVLHKIKPTIELFGMTHILGEVKEAENAGRQGQDPDKMPGWLDFIVPRLEACITDLKEEVKNYN